MAEGLRTFSPTAAAWQFRSLRRDCAFAKFFFFSHFPSGPGELDIFTAPSWVAVLKPAGGLRFCKIFLLFPFSKWPGRSGQNPAIASAHVMKQIFAIFFQLFPVTKRPKASEQVAGLLLQRSCPAGGAKNSPSLFQISSGPNRKNALFSPSPAWFLPFLRHFCPPGHFPIWSAFFPFPRFISGHFPDLHASRRLPYMVTATAFALRLLSNIASAQSARAGFVGRRALCARARTHLVTRSPAIHAEDDVEMDKCCSSTRINPSIFRKTPQW